MKALKHFVLMAMFFVSAPAVMADLVILQWNHDILPLSHTVEIDFDFNGNTYDLRFEKRDAGSMLNQFQAMPSETCVLSGAGTVMVHLDGLNSQTTYEIKYKVVDGFQLLEEHTIYGVTPLPIPTFTPNEEPNTIGGTTTFGILLNEYGNPDWFDPLLMGNSNYETVLTIHLTLPDGTVESVSRILDGAGNLSWETFDFELNVTGQYYYCFELTYAEVAGFGDFGPIPVMTSCIIPLPFYFGGGSLDVSGGFGPIFTILFANGAITILSDGAPGTYMICDVMGRVVAEKRSVSEAFDVSVLPSSTYVVTAFDSTGKAKAHKTYSIIR